MDAADLAARFAAATDWLKPSLRSPDRSSAAAWAGEVLGEPHTRQLLDAILKASRVSG